MPRPIAPKKIIPATAEEREAFFEAVDKHRGRRIDPFYALFPDNDTMQPDGRMIHSRHKYVRHMEFFEAGATYRERCFMAANRVGKTIGAGYELSLHLTGEYPDWWPGRRFDHPVRAWAAGKTNETTRDILQTALLGDIVARESRKAMSGTGLLPSAMIERPTWKQGVQDMVDTVQIAHVSGKYSALGFKSYQQGRGSFEGTAQHVILCDEEPPKDVYDECLIRTATVNGIIMLSFTPLEGLSEVVLQFMPQEHRPGTN